MSLLGRTKSRSGGSASGGGIINQDRYNETRQLAVQRAAKKAANRAKVERSRASFTGSPKRKRATGRPPGRTTGRSTSTPKTSRTNRQSFSLNNVNSGTGNTNATLTNGSEPSQKKTNNSSKFISTGNTNQKTKNKPKNKRNSRQDNPSGTNRFSREIAKVRDHNLKYLERLQSFLDALTKELQNTPQNDLIGRRNLQKEIEKYQKLVEGTKKLINKQNQSIRELNKVQDKRKNLRQEAERRRKKQAEEAKKAFEQHMMEQQAKKVRQGR